MTTTLPEAGAFSAIAEQTPANALVYCQGWTAYDLMAHVVAGGAEIARLLQHQASGPTVPATTAFEEREPVFRALPYGQLVELTGRTTLGDAISAVAETDPEATLSFTGWSMTAAELLTHVRSELALHRWDIVGTDELGGELLAQPDLTVHAIKSLARFDVISERVTERTRRSGVDRVDARLRVDGQPDVHLLIDGSHQRVDLVEATDEPALETTAADRLLMLWGRRPCPSSRARSSLDPTMLRATLAWLNA
jgi:hypothetical protein